MIQRCNRIPKSASMFRKSLALCALLMISGVASAENIYKCVSPEGNITFSNNPYCEQKQAHIKRQYEKVRSVEITELTETPPGQLMEIYFPEMELPDLLEDIGKFAHAPIEPIALEGIEVKITVGSQPWFNLFKKLVKENDLQYRLAYKHLYVYKVGTMGDTIVNSPDLLRWYQSDASWNAVLKVDDMLLAMAPYQNTELKERLNTLLWRVREELGEEAAVNSAQEVNLQNGVTAGVGSGIAAQESTDALIRRNNEAKARRITERRQSN